MSLDAFNNDVLLNMTESGCADQSKNGSFQNQEEQASTSGLPRRRRKQSPPIWEQLMKKKAPRGNPEPWSSNKAIATRASHQDYFRLPID